MDSDSDPDGSLTLIGSAHISEAYFEHVEDAIRTAEPDIVAVELDPQRLASIFNDTDTSTTDVFRQFSVRAGLLYLVLSYGQTRLANAVGIDPEMNDMRVAVETAAETESRVALIDRDITTTLERVSDNLSIRTFGRMWLRSRRLDAGDIPSSSMQDVLTDIENAEVFAEYRNYIEQVVPEFSEAFIHERDQLMAKRLHTLEQAGHDIIAVVGGAHEPGIRAELETLRADADTEPSISTPLVAPVEEPNDE